MADFIRSLSNTERAMLTIFLSVAIKGVLLTQWEAYKARQALLPIPMKLKNGVHIPNGPVQRIQRIWQVIIKVWVVYMLILIGLLIYMKAMGLPRLF